MHKLTKEIWNNFIARPQNKKGKPQLSVRKLNEIIEQYEKRTCTINRETEYINNPVDYVEVKHVTKEYIDDQDAYGYDVNYYSVSFSLEKELPLLPYEYKPEDCLQETLEEAIERLESDYNVLGNDFSNGFYEGVEYQAERMYSEEEVHKIIGSHTSFISGQFVGSEKRAYYEWFEQFKKK